MIHYWLTPKVDSEQLEREAPPICDAYRSAPDRAADGAHTICCDEKTGIQALERTHPPLPMRPSHVERPESDYERYGTQCLIANFEVATGQLVACTVGDRRTEADFLAHIQQTVATDPAAEWLFLVDQLNTHKSASLVHWIAATLEDPQDLGRKSEACTGYGILRHCATRGAYLSDPEHRIRFLYIPKHCSWLNQVEIWFSILSRRLLKRLSVTSLAELRERILAFIDYYNATKAKRFKWTYTGRPLAA